MGVLKCCADGSVPTPPARRNRARKQRRKGGGTEATAAAAAKKDDTAQSGGDHVTRQLNMAARHLLLGMKALRRVHDDAADGDEEEEEEEGDGSPSAAEHGGDTAADVDGGDNAGADDQSGADEIVDFAASQYASMKSQLFDVCTRLALRLSRDDRAELALRALDDALGCFRMTLSSGGSKAEGGDDLGRVGKALTQEQLGTILDICGDLCMQRSDDVARTEQAAADMAAAAQDADAPQRVVLPSSVTIGSLRHVVAMVVEHDSSATGGDPRVASSATDWLYYATRCYEYASFVHARRNAVESYT